MKHIIFGLAALAVSGCTTSGVFGGDWLYQTTVDPITNQTQSFAMLMLPHNSFTDQPNYFAATCTSDGFEFFVASEGFWGQGSSYFRQNQRFELRLGDKLFKGRYLPSTDGDSAYLISGNPKFSAIKAKDILDGFSQASTVAIRIMDYQGSPNTSTVRIGGNSDNLRKVAADCGVR